ELGCASGGNLVPMAESLAQSSCLGIDLSSRQIEDGNRFIAQTGLRNVSLRQASILDINESDGEFDYIVCHGVYSWVPRHVQAAILELCSKRLSPNGIAYISYNTLPGWGMLGVLRDMMRFHASHFAEPAKQIEQSRALLKVLAAAVPSEENPYGMLLNQVSEKVQKSADWYIYHEHLEEDNDPVYFHQFNARAEAVGLQFLGEAELLTMFSNQLPENVQAALRGVSGNIVRSEQYMDFFRNRTFRETLLCRGGAQLKRKIDAERIRPLSFASELAPRDGVIDLKPGVEVTFSAPGRGSVGVRDPIFKAALGALREAWPRFVSTAELEGLARKRLELGPATTETTNAFVERLWNWFTHRLVQMSSVPAACVSLPSERPVGSVVARAQLAAGRAHLTNLLHSVVRVGTFEARVLSLLDGSRDRRALGQALQGSEHAAEAAKVGRVDAALRQLAAAALLKA
ncbi:MAG TPA: class I SAM-dependent methyltransferase, partial [Polyangiaceae bacterium]|nr:class I SAM-dependent methyltransferase [Polyangiaceae bacterium]